MMEKTGEQQYVEMIKKISTIPIDERQSSINKFFSAYSPLPRSIIPGRKRPYTYQLRRKTTGVERYRLQQPYTMLYDVITPTVNSDRVNSPFTTLVTAR